MSLKRITTITVVEVETGTVVSSQTNIESLDIVEKDPQPTPRLLHRPNTLIIQDTAEVVGAGTSVPATNRAYDDVYVDVKKACNKVFHRIAERRDIGDSTVRANTIRNTGIGTAAALYGGITKFLVEGDMSLAEHLLDCAQTPEEEALIMEAFNGEA